MLRVESGWKWNESQIFVASSDFPGIDAHGVENPGEGVPEVFAKIPRGGGSRLLGKIAWGRPLFWVLLLFY
jgi:hypothetical protein